MYTRVEAVTGLQEMQQAILSLAQRFISDLDKGAIGTNKEPEYCSIVKVILFTVLQLDYFIL